MSKQHRLLSLTLALTLCAGVLLFHVTAYAAEVTDDAAAAISESGVGTEEPFGKLPGDPEDADPGAAVDDDAGELPDSLDLSSLLGTLFGGGLSLETGLSGPNLTPDGTGTVMDNVFIYGNDLEFFTFTTEAGNIFYLVIDRSRTKDNVYLLNTVTEWDLMALSEAEGGTGTGKPSGSTSGIPNTPGGIDTPGPGDDPAIPEDPPGKKGGIDSGTLIFILIGVAAVGGAAYYIKIVRPKQQRAADDDGSDFGDDYDDYDDYGEPDEEYGEDDASGRGDEE